MSFDADFAFLILFFFVHSNLCLSKEPILPISSHVCNYAFEKKIQRSREKKSTQNVLLTQ